MKIEFSKAEYRTLLELLYLAEWMLTAHDDAPDPAKERHYLLCQKIYASAKAMGLTFPAAAERQRILCFEFVKARLKQCNDGVVLATCEQHCGIGPLQHRHSKP